MRRSRVAQVVVGLVLAGSVAGCGDDASSTSEEPTPTVVVTETVTETPTPAPEPTEPAAPSETPAGEGAVPRTYDDALARFDALGQEPVTYRTFATDTDIYCVLDDKEIAPGCELGQRDGVKDPDVCGEALTNKVGRIEIDGARVDPVCNTDTIRGDMPSVLQPGEAARAGDLQCLNDLGGVVCVSVSSTAGFFMRPGEYVIFNAG